MTAGEIMKAFGGRMMSKLIMLVCLILAAMADHLGAQTRADEEARFARLRVVYPAPSPTYLASWIAREGDHFKEQGLNVELIVSLR